MLEIGFIHVSGESWRPVIVYKFDELGMPQEYTYFTNDNKQVVILQRQQQLRMTARVQANANKKAEDDEIDDVVSLGVR